MRAAGWPRASNPIRDHNFAHVGAPRDAKPDFRVELYDDAPSLHYRTVFTAVLSSEAPRQLLVEGEGGRVVLSALPRLRRDRAERSPC